METRQKTHWRGGRDRQDHNQTTLGDEESPVPIPPYTEEVALMGE